MNLPSQTDLISIKLDSSLAKLASEEPRLALFVALGAARRATLLAERNLLIDPKIAEIALRQLKTSATQKEDIKAQLYHSFHESEAKDTFFPYVEDIEYLKISKSWAEDHIFRAILSGIEARDEYPANHYFLQQCILSCHWAAAGIELATRSIYPYGGSLYQKRAKEFGLEAKEKEVQRQYDISQRIFNSLILTRSKALRAPRKRISPLVKHEEGLERY